MRKKSLYMKLFSVFLIIFLLIIDMAGVFRNRDTVLANTSAEATKGIIILHTNDVHCSFTRGEPKNTFGLADLAAYRAKLEDEGYDTILVDAGDFVQGGTLGTVSSGNYLLILMNAMNYDVAVPGNHDFDFGMKQFNNAVKYLNCSYISCNFMNLSKKKTVLKSYKIVEKDGIKIGFVGVTTPQTTKITKTKYFKNSKGKWVYGFCGGSKGTQLYTQVQKSINAAKKAGAQMIILVGHTGVGSSFTPWTSVEVISNTTGIDAYIDAHSHSVVNTTIPDKSGKPVVLVQTGSRLSRIGQMTIDVNNGNAISTKLVKTSEYTVTSNQATNEYKAFKKIKDLIDTMK